MFRKSEESDESDDLSSDDVQNSKLKKTCKKTSGKNHKVTLIKGPWTEEEDWRVLQLVEQHGP